MDSVELAVQPLSREAFARFGEVIETTGVEHYPINEGTTERFHNLARVDVGAEHGEPLISIFRGTPRAAPIEIKMMERHPLGSQAFMPLQAHDYLIVVAEPGRAPSPADLHAFRATGIQGVSYHRNTWHHPLLVLQHVHDFLVIDRGGPGDNCDEYFFTEDQGMAMLVG